MNPQVLQQAVSFVAKIEYVLISTASKTKEPHIAVATRMDLVDNIHVTVSAWFCPTTVINLFENPSLSLVIWDQENDTGYQLIGASEGIENMAVLGCWTPEVDKQMPVPQVERRVLVRVDRIIDFKHAPHNDIEE
jgi:uncharacterized protein